MRIIKNILFISIWFSTLFYLLYIFFVFIQNLNWFKSKLKSQTQIDSLLLNFILFLTKQQSLKKPSFIFLAFLLILYQIIFWFYLSYFKLFLTGMEGPSHEDLAITVLTCKGDLRDPSFPFLLNKLVCKLRRLVSDGNF